MKTTRLHNRISVVRFIALLCLSCSCAQAMKHTFHVTQGKSLIGPVGVPFGFNVKGHYALTVHDFELTSAKGKNLDRSVEAGFFLQKFENEAAFNQHMDYLRTNTSACSFQHFLSSNDYDATFYNAADDDSNFDDVTFGIDDDEYTGGDILSSTDGIFLSMKTKKNWKPATPSIEYLFKPGEAGFYFLIYQVCPFDDDILSTFKLEFHFDNVDSFGNESFLSAGEMKLPVMYFYFSISYLLCFFIWYTNIRLIQQGGQGHFAQSGERPVIYHIHQLMTLLLLLKFFSVIFESVRYYSIKVTGHAEVWSFIFYAVSFVKGTFLFTVILLIGTGWSFVKPFLNGREKKIILVILVLQVVNNIAIIVLSQETEGESSYATWAGLLHIVDILCCCAVLVPIVWQVNELEKSVGLDDIDSLTELSVSERASDLEAGDKGQILSKLKLFRTFYLVVVAYIYSTRILVYLFASMLDYRHLWVQHFVIEVVTLTFYVSVGMLFRPVSDAAAYQSVNSSQDDAVTCGVELGARGDSKKH